MKTMTKLALALVLVAGLAFVVQAGEKKEVMLKGDLACAHCTFKLEGAEGCQSVLMVAAPDGAETYYWVVKNDVSEKFGHVCKDKKTVMMTGAVAEKEGKTWITPSKIEEAEG